jgi:hypothetical protein
MPIEGEITIDHVVDTAVEWYSNYGEDPLVIAVREDKVELIGKNTLIYYIRVDNCQLYFMLREKLGRRVKTCGNLIIVSKYPLKQALKRARVVPKLHI